MTIYYVDHNGSNTSPYDTWAKAATSLASLPAVTVADTIYVSSGHQQATAAFTIPGESSGNDGGPTYISADDTSGEPPSTYQTMVAGGGYLQTTGSSDITISDSLSAYGLNIESDKHIQMIAGVGEFIYLNDCTLEVGLDDNWSFNSPGGRIQVEDCAFTCGVNTASDNLGGLVLSGSGGYFNIINGTWSSCDYRDEILNNSTSAATVNILGCDFSAYGSLASPKLVGTALHEAFVTMVGCTLPTAAGFSLGDTMTDQHGYVIGIDCDGTNGDRERSFIRHNLGEMDTWGGSNTDREVYRTGGFTPPDQTNPICWRVLATSLTRANYNTPFTLLPMSIWNDTTAATVTVTCEFLLGDASTVDPLDNDEIWIRVDYYAAAGTTVLTSEWTRPATVLTTPTAETTAGSSWTTTDAETATTAYKIEHTTGSNVGRKGPIQVTWFIASLGTNDAIYVDPILTLS